MTERLSREEFYARFPHLRPSQGDIDAVAGGYLRENEYDIAYIRGRQADLSHEEATQAAQKAVYGEVRSEKVGVETPANSAMARTPLSSPLPAVRAAVEQLEASEPVVLPSGVRMAMKYGLPSLGILLGLYGLDAISNPPEYESENRSQAAGAR